jgi:hypothetical protein
VVQAPPERPDPAAHVRQVPSVPLQVAQEAEHEVQEAVPPAEN